jgi:lysophospholipase L1-like esterase
MQKKFRLILGITSIILIVISVNLYLFRSYLRSYFLGNSSRYAISEVDPLEDSPIEGKSIIFLGSSVTAGSAAKGLSFVDYIAKRNSVSVIKEAVSGTTLTDKGEESYIQRMIHNIDANYSADYFVCQLSTNDASKNYPLGEISDSINRDDLNTSTITGAIEYIIQYAQDTWNCPVVFYTGTYYDSPEYSAMVVRLLDLQEKYAFHVINMWDNEEMQQSFKDYYMVDDIHPSRAGYLEWWTPVIEEALWDIDPEVY